MNKTAFTLLEVLIALVITTISLIGVYRLIDFSSNTLTSAKNKFLLINKAYEYVLLKNFDTNKLSDFKENLDIKDTTEANIYDVLEQKSVTISDKNEEINLIYFVKK